MSNVAILPISAYSHHIVIRGEVAQWLTPRICSANREVGGSPDDSRFTGVNVVDALLRVRAYAAPGSLSRMYKKLCMRVK